MTTQDQRTLFDVESALRARLTPGETGGDFVRRIVQRARQRLAHLDRVKKEFVVDATERGVVAIHPGERAVWSGAAGRRHAERGRTELLEYLEGRRSFFEVPVDLAGCPDFQRLVLEETARIPFGETRSYSEMAARIGHPRAARAVGTALGRNPVAFIVPCHRVLRGDASLGGYGFGLPMKADLLELERTTPVLEGCTTTRVLCRVGCGALARVKPANRVVFASVADARSVGYRPCRLCRPDAA